MGKSAPVRRKDYDFPIVGVVESLAFGETSPLAGDIILPPGPAGRMDKLPFTSIWDLFRAGEGKGGYSALNVRLTSPAFADPVKAKAREMGFDTFALADQFEQIKKSFVYMDMMLAAIGMIAIFVAALGIVNTMVMSILERYGEIGIMKAVGAARRDIRRIFLLEAALIGFAGGVGRAGPGLDGQPDHQPGHQLHPLPGRGCPSSSISASRSGSASAGSSSPSASASSPASIRRAGPPAWIRSSP